MELSIVLKGDVEDNFSLKNIYEGLNGKNHEITSVSGKNYPVKLVDKSLRYSPVENISTLAYTKKQPYLSLYSKDVSYSCREYLSRAIYSHTKLKDLGVTKVLGNKKLNQAVGFIVLFNLRTETDLEQLATSLTNVLNIGEVRIEYSKDKTIRILIGNHTHAPILSSWSVLAVRKPEFAAALIKSNKILIKTSSLEKARLYLMDKMMRTTGSMTVQEKFILPYALSRVEELSSVYSIGPISAIESLANAEDIYKYISKYYKTLLGEYTAGKSQNYDTPSDLVGLTFGRIFDIVHKELKNESN